jgi:hypothetical protein
VRRNSISLYRVFIYRIIITGGTKKMKIVWMSVLLSALLVAGCASSKAESQMRVGYDFTQLNKIAVLDVTGAIRGETAKNQISSFFEMEMLGKGYTPVVRADAIKTLLKEQEFQTSGITSNEDAAKAGRILNVQAVLLVNIPSNKEEINMTAKMVDVQDGGILWVGSASGSTGKTLATVAGAVAGAAAGAVIAGGDTRDRVAGGVIGGVIGGVAGNALSPQQADQIEKIVKKLCKEMPSRIQTTKK